MVVPLQAICKIEARQAVHFALTSEAMIPKKKDPFKGRRGFCGKFELLKLYLLHE